MKAVGNKYGEIIVYRGVRHLYYLDYRPSQDAAAEAWKPSPDDVTKHSKA